MNTNQAIDFTPEQLVKFQQMHLNEVYNERDRLVALISTLYPSHLAKHTGENWDESWRNVVYVNTSEGQLSWHISDEELPLFKHLSYGDNTWDGHSTEEKYKRIEKLVSKNAKKLIKNEEIEKFIYAEE